MLERTLSWLERIKLSRRDQNLPPEELARQLILGLYQYITSDPNGDLTAGRLTRFLGLGDVRRLTRLIMVAYKPCLRLDFKKFIWIFLIKRISGGEYKNA